MNQMKLGVVETQFAEIIWNNEPLSSGELVEICKKNLNWKKSTTYTVLRKLCERSLFKNENGMVSSCISKEDFYAYQSEDFVNETFNGSLPAFIAAFTRRKNLSQKEIKEIKDMIESYGKGKKK